MGHAQLTARLLCRLGPDSSSVPNFAIQGNPNLPEILSNKLILTPPAPGNQRAAIWADRPLAQTNWIADIDFRANSPDRGGGNLNIWLAKDGAHTVGSASVYTVGRFEGLVLVVDGPGGSSGKIRAFLNDGTKDFKAQQVDGLSFGHCDYAYRNRGRPSQIKLRQTDTTFKVDIDGQACFASDSISIPPGYNFGVSAASADNPRVVRAVQAGRHDRRHARHRQQAGAAGLAAQGPAGAARRGRPPAGQVRARRRRRHVREPAAGTPDAPYEKDVPDEEAGKITSSTAQFADLHNRLQSVNHHLSTIFRQTAQLGTIGEQRHQEISVQVGEIKGLMSKLDRILTFEDRMEHLEREMMSIHADLKSTVASSEQSVLYQVAGTWPATTTTWCRTSSRPATRA